MHPVSATNVNDTSVVELSKSVGKIAIDAVSVAA